MEARRSGTRGPILTQAAVGQHYRAPVLLATSLSSKTIRRMVSDLPG
jgi:hypothetical protein